MLLCDFPRVPHCEEADGEAGVLRGSPLSSSSQKVILISGLASRGTTEFLEPLVRHLVLFQKDDSPLLEVCTFDNRGVGESSAPQVCPQVQFVISFVILHLVHPRRFPYGLDFNVATVDVVPRTDAAAVQSNFGMSAHAAQSTCRPMLNKTCVHVDRTCKSWCVTSKLVL